MRLTTDTAHACPAARHACMVCGEPIHRTRKGVTPRWVHAAARTHNALHHVGTCRVEPHQITETQQGDSAA